MKIQIIPTCASSTSCTTILSVQSTLGKHDINLNDYAMMHYSKRHVFRTEKLICLLISLEYHLRT